jgi:hypothetical protein
MEHVATPEAIENGGLVMKLTRMLKRLLAQRLPARISRRRQRARLPRLEDLEFRVIPATDDHIYHQDVRPALLAQLLAAERSR